MSLSLSPIRTTVLIALGALAMSPDARGEGLFGRHYQKKAEPGAPRSIEHTHARAGWPLCVSAHASPSNTPAYDGGYVGGGGSHHGEARGPSEGTWGWDYVGTHLPRRVFLRWAHGGPAQDGNPYYLADFPRYRDPVRGAATVTRRLHEGGEEEP
jgi:hypothetical protein